PGRDEVEVIAEAARLTGAQVEQLRRRLLLQRIARTFSVERGGYVFGRQITVATMRGVAVDVAPAIFLGVRMNLAQDRLVEDLRRFGARFVLRTNEVDEARFGFGPHERPILHALRFGTSLPDLEAKRRDLEPRLMQAVIYTLVAAGLCEGFPSPRMRDAEEIEVEDEDDDPEEAAIARARTTTFDRTPRGEAEAQEQDEDELADTLRQPRTRTISSMPPPFGITTDGF